MLFDFAFILSVCANFLVTLLPMLVLPCLLLALAYSLEEVEK